MRAALLLAALVLVPAVAAAEPPAGWDGGCDAQASACLYRRPAAEGGATLLLARRPGSDGLAIGFAFAAAVPDPARAAALGLDGQPLATLRPDADLRAIDDPADRWLVGAAVLDRLAARLAAAGTLRLSYLDILGEPHDATFDLGGAGEIVAALAVGDVDKPSTVAPKPRSDLQLPERGEAIRRLGVPARVAEHQARMTACEALDSPRLAGHAPLIAELSPTAVLYALPCAAGRDSLLSRLWVLEFGEIGGIAPQSFALYQPRLGWIGEDTLPNVAWDAAARRLTAHAAPATGCAWTGAWRWRGTTFGLDELTLINCDGRRGRTRVFPTR